MTCVVGVDGEASSAKDGLTSGLTWDSTGSILTCTGGTGEGKGLAGLKGTTVGANGFSRPACTVSRLGVGLAGLKNTTVGASVLSGLAFTVGEGVGDIVMVGDFVVGVAGGVMFSVAFTVGERVGDRVMVGDFVVGVAGGVMFSVAGRGSTDTKARGLSLAETTGRVPISSCKTNNQLQRTDQARVQI